MHRVTIQPADNTRKDTEDLIRIVADDPYFEADLGKFRLELDLFHLETFEICHIILADCKIVDRVDVARSDRTLESTLSENRIGVCRSFSNNMSIGQYKTILR